MFKHMTATSKNVYFDVLDDILIMLEFQNIKTFLLKDIVQIGQKKLLLLVKLKAHVVSDLTGGEITGSFYEKNC